MPKLSEAEYEILKEKFREFLKEIAPDFQYLILIYDEEGMYSFGLGDLDMAKYACLRFIQTDTSTRAEIESFPKGAMN